MSTIYHANCEYALPPVKEHPECNIPILYRVVFNFTRSDGAEYIAYLSQVEIFHKAILRSKLDFVFTTGFNPLPRLEFACAMTLGIPSMQETASVYLYEMCDEKTFIDSLNAVLPSNFCITDAYIFPVTNMRKRESLSSSLWGCKYSYEIFSEFDAASFFKSKAFTDFKNKYPQAEFYSENENDSSAINYYSFTADLPSSDKNFRLCLEEFFNAKWFEICKIVKIKTLAKDEVTGWTASDEHKWRYDNKNFRKDGNENHSNSDKEETVKSPVEFFDLYKKIALVNKELIEERRITDLEIQNKNN